ncbi:MAG TPA: hypothetical protein VHY10_16370 [Xanthobacteraceae bacterium]|jgi:hypothetical protein|nr:hypothetical protein [Xanthobacteraceae bacterium]
MSVCKLRRLLLAGAVALAATFAPALPALPAQLYQSQMLGCNQEAPFTASSVAQLVAAIANQQIYICGFTFNAGASAANIELEYGTGTNCGTGTMALTPDFALGANGVLSDHSPFFNGLTVPLGNNLCVLPSAAAVGLVYYQQF